MLTLRAQRRACGNFKKVFENLHRHLQFKKKNLIVASLIVIIDFQNQWNVESSLALQACI